MTDHERLAPANVRNERLSSSTRRRARTSQPASRLARAIVAAPDRLVLMLLCVALVVELTLLFDVFLPVVVVSAVVILVAATWTFAPEPLVPTRENVRASGAALALAVAWIAANVPFVARFLVVTRDPGFLTLESIWLSSHGAPEIPNGAASQAALGILGARSSGDAFYLANGDLYAQGAKLVPGVVAIPGWLFGEHGVLVGNLVVGAIALLAVFGLARRMTTSGWALVAFAALGVSIPMVAFSRSVYTEPLALALLFGGLTLAWSAFSTRRTGHFVLAGTLIGATGMARIDGLSAVLGFIAAFTLAAAVATLPTVARRLRRQVFLAVLAALATSAIGFIDLRLDSPGYLHDLWPSARLLIAATGLAAVLGLALTVPRFLDPLRAWTVHRRRGIGRTLAGGVALLALVLLSRPLWYEARHTAAGSAYAIFVAAVQRSDGTAVDPTRSYDEQSMNWLAWYHGWPMVVLAVAGLALIAYRASARRDPRHLIVACVIGVPSALYLVRVSITPDQVWAMRRFLPATIPGFLVAAVVALHALDRSRWRWRRPAVVALAAALIIWPLTTWGSLFGDIDEGGRVAQIASACQAVDAAHASRIVYVRPGGTPFYASLRVVCGDEVVEFTTPPSREALATLRKKWGEQPIALISFTPDNIPWVAPPSAPWSTTTIVHWSRSLIHPPTGTMTETQTLWAGTILPDGSVEPLAPPHR